MIIITLITGVAVRGCGPDVGSYPKTLPIANSLSCSPLAHSLIFTTAQPFDAPMQQQKLQFFGYGKQISSEEAKRQREKEDESEAADRLKRLKEKEQLPDPPPKRPVGRPPNTNAQHIRRLVSELLVGTIKHLIRRSAKPTYSTGALVPR